MSANPEETSALGSSCRNTTNLPQRETPGIRFLLLLVALLQLLEDEDDEGISWLSQQATNAALEYIVSQTFPQCEEVVLLFVKGLFFFSSFDVFFV